MSDEDPLLYPGTEVLRNKLDIRDPAVLESAERRLVEQRISEGCPTGNFDLPHLQAIHRHLFQDVLEWAGQVRGVAISKAQSSFMHPERIVGAMEDVHRRIVDADFFQGTDPEAFSDGAAKIIGDINYVHPFREGNGRTQLQYLKQLAEQAGHEIDLTKLVGERWIEASILANRAKYDPMAVQIQEAITRVLEKAPSEEEAFRRALNDRQEEERLQLLKTHTAERAEVASRGDGEAARALKKQQAAELQELDNRHEAELGRYLLEREEARRLKEELEERRRLEDQALDKKSQERER